MRLGVGSWQDIRGALWEEVDGSISPPLGVNTSMSYVITPQRTHSDDSGCWLLLGLLTAGAEFESRSLSATKLINLSHKRWPCRMGVFGIR